MSVWWRSSTQGASIELKARSTSSSAFLSYAETDIWAISSEGIVPTHNGDIYMQLGGTGRVWITILGYYVDWNQASADTMQGLTCAADGCQTDASNVNATWIYAWGTNPPNNIQGVESVPMIWGPSTMAPSSV